MSGEIAVAWSAIRDELEREIERCRDGLERATGEDIPKLQGRIAGLRAALDTPNTIRASIVARREATP